MKVILINPPQTQLHRPRAYVPLGLAYVGAVLEQSGIEVEIENMADVPIEEFSIDMMPDSDIYGITCVTATYPAVVKLSDMLKANEKKVVVGGVHPSVLPLETLKDTKCDHVIVGEAEYAFRDLVLGRIKGRVINAGLMKNLDALPLPARHLFSKEDIVDKTGIHGQDKGVGATTLITSRGCPFSCKYCCKIPQTSKVRLHSANRIITEINSITEEYKINHFRFVDDIFTVARKRVLEFCSLASEIEISWICITRGDALDEELLKRMEKAGCKEVHIGVESGSQRMLNLMGKGTTVEQNLKAIKMIRTAGILTKVYLMFGYPGEEGKDTEATKIFMMKAKPDKWTLSQFTPLPGSSLWDPATRTNGWFYPDSEEKYGELKNWLRSEAWRRK